MNDKNLKPFNQRTTSEQREIARAGGIASGEARRKNKTIRERLLLIMEERTDSGGATLADKVAAALMQKAAAGDLKAIRLLGEYLGEFKQKVELQSETRKPSEVAREILEALGE